MALTASRRSNDIVEGEETGGVPGQRGRDSVRAQSEGFGGSCQC